MSNQRAKWSDEFTAEERVEMVATSLTESRSVNWIADSVEVAHQTASKYLQQLEKDGKVTAETAGQHTTYRPGPVSQYLHEMRDLYTNHTPEELTSSLEEMADQIATWKETYDVESVNKLQAKLGDIEDHAERKERKTTITKWSNLKERKEIVGSVLMISDRIPDRSNTKA